MRRFSHLLLLASLLIAGTGVALALRTSAQEATPATNLHPLVGAWIVDPEIDDPANPPSFDVFMADGTLVNIGSDGASIGVWAPTGPASAIMTFNGLLGDQGSDGMFVIRGDIFLNEDGSVFTGTHSFSMLAPDGTVVASFQGGTQQGTRMVAEGPELGDQPLPGFQPWTPATPIATPAS